MPNTARRIRTFRELVHESDIYRIQADNPYTHERVIHSIIAPTEEYALRQFANIWPELENPIVLK